MHYPTINEDLAAAGRLPATARNSDSRCDRRVPAQNSDECMEAIQQSRRQWNRLTCIRTIGTGTYASVRLVVDETSNRVLALKTICRSSITTQKSLQRAKDEKSILSKLHHTFVVDYCDSFQDSKHVYLLMDYVPGGELYSLLAKRERLSIREAKFYVSEVAAALTYLHSEGIVYRDLKPENVLISASGHIKLADFGFAKRLKNGEKTYSLVGTPHYLAPEIVKRCGHGFESDWWTLGILLYELLEGVSPFDAPTPYEMYTNIVAKDFEPPKEFDSDVHSLITGLLRKAPELRLKGSEVLQHSFFAGMNWTAIESADPPHVPLLKGHLDASHFAYFEEEGAGEEAVLDSRTFQDF